MKQSFMSLMFLIIILAAFGYFISKAMKYKTEREKNAIMITMQEVIPIDFIEHKIKILEKLKKEFPNNEELRIKIITLKELLEELKR